MNTFRVSKLKVPMVLVASSQLIACSAFDLHVNRDSAWPERWVPDFAVSVAEGGAPVSSVPGQGYELMMYGVDATENRVASPAQPSESFIQPASYPLPVNSQAPVRLYQPVSQRIQPVGAFSHERIRSRQGWQFDTSDPRQAATQMAETQMAETQMAVSDAPRMGVREMPKRPQMELAKVSLDIDRGQGYCQQKKIGFGKDLTTKYNELMALYMSQAEVLSQSEMASRTKYQLMSDVSLKFLDSQTKARGLEYLNETLYGLCRLHALGVMEETKYHQSVNALLDGTARQLMIDVRKLRLDANARDRRDLKEVSNR